MLQPYLGRLDEIAFSDDWARQWVAGRLGPTLPTDALRSLAALDVPTLLLHGRQDMTFPVECVERAATLVPRAHARLLDNAGHMAHVDQPDVWLDSLCEFLDN
jgi:pimeloyl-ACP methyl ester carboxylesterase